MCQVFRKGRLIVIGGKSVREAEELLNMYLSVLNTLGVKTEHTGYCVQDEIASYNLGRPVNLSKLAHAGQTRTIFEPELFSALTLYCKTPKATVNIFHSGKCMILGLKGPDLLPDVVRQIDQLVAFSPECPENIDQIMAEYRMSRQPSGVRNKKNREA